MKKSLILILIILTNISQASRIGVVDTNFDIESGDLSSHVERSSTYNFDIGDSNVFDDQTLDSEMFDRFKNLTSLQIKLENEKRLCDEDALMLKELSLDQNLISATRTIIEHIHGTHVAGIASKDSEHQLVLIKWNYYKYLFTPKLNLDEKKISDDTNTNLDSKIRLIVRSKFSFLTKIGDLLRRSNVRIANFSWGMNYFYLRDYIYEIKNSLGIPSSDDNLYERKILSEIVNFLSDFMENNNEILFVVAAGNENTDLDKYPSLFTLKKFNNLITVGAISQAGNKASFSNYGKGAVDIYCPGVGIESNAFRDQKIRLSGTSQAAPYAANRIGNIVDSGIKDKKEIISNLVSSSKCIAKD